MIKMLRSLEILFYLKSFRNLKKKSSDFKNYIQETNKQKEQGSGLLRCLGGDQCESTDHKAHEASGFPVL